MMRWKKHPRETGLRAVGVGPHRSSDLRLDDVRVATVSPSGGDWREPLKGWYFVAGWDDPRIPYRNTHDALVPTEAEAKAQAVGYVKQVLAASAATSPK